MPSSIPGLLSAAGAGPLLRSASAVVAKAARGFHVFRIDGYPWTKTLPGGERITSKPFTVGGRIWEIDYYPNGTDVSKDTADSIALYLRLTGTQHPHNYSSYNHSINRPELVRAQYKFSLLDLAGNAAYELPAEMGIFKEPLRAVNYHYHQQLQQQGNKEEEDPRCGYTSFITKEDMEKRRDSLLKADCLAIRCDVGVTMTAARTLAEPKRGRSSKCHYNGYTTDDCDESSDDDEGRRKRSQSQKPLDDKEYIRQCLSSTR